MPKNTDWRHRELTKWIGRERGEPSFEDRTVYLANPKLVKEIDALIRRYFWPAIQKGLKGAGLGVSGDALDQLATVEDMKYTARSLTFLIEDPDRPWNNLPHGPVPPWHCRGNLRCSRLSYMLSFDFLIHLPISFSKEKIIEFIGEPRFSGLPPELTVTSDRNGQKFYQIAFHEGRGADFGLKNPRDIAGSISERVKQNVDIAKCVDDVLRNSDSDWAFARLKKALLNGYEAC